MGSGSTSSLSCLLTAETSDCRHPCRTGHLRQCALKRNRRIHEVLLFLSIKAPRIAASLLPAHFLEALGRRLMVFSDLLGESAGSGDRAVLLAWGHQWLSALWSEDRCCQKTRRMVITRASGGIWTMLSNQHGIGDSNRMETDRCTAYAHSLYSSIAPCGLLYRTPLQAAWCTKQPI